MRDDDPDKPVNNERESAEREREREAEQQRGRERMIALWRAAVQSVTEAAQREAAAAKAEQERADDDDLPAVATWAFPPKVRAAS